MIRVVVAMSGGVDSSVAAAILKSQGYDVTGIMLRLWSEQGKETVNRCCTPDSLAIARRVAARLDIPFHVVDAQQLFRNVVVDYFLQGYSKGLTPNPCLVCNRNIRWDFLLKRVHAMGVDFMATGHYARIDPPPVPPTSPRQSPSTQKLEEPKEEGDEIHYSLLRGVDRQKDQSYVLSVLTQEQLRYTIFPVGGYTKQQVRQLACDFNLPVADRGDSQDLCFLGDEDYREFLRRHVPEVEMPGLIITGAGQKLGEHRGLAFYTIGQRKGLGISSSEPMYVLKKDLSENLLIVGSIDELGRYDLIASEVNWLSRIPPSSPIRAQVKIRYKASDAWGLITPLHGARVAIRFDFLVRDITPGQFAVFYDGELCLGSGIIEI